MAEVSLSVNYVGGPTAVLEFGGLRFITDPAFDPPGGDYTTGPVTLHKTEPPAVEARHLGPLDVVLLSHDHHFDNLDHEGRALLERVRHVVTTAEGVRRLGSFATGLEPWQTLRLGDVTITATPARHGPVDGDRGPVIGFVLEQAGVEGAVYVSGDTVWFEGVEEVSRRYDVRYAVLFLGAARVEVVGPDHLTMTAAEGVLAARAFPRAAILPVHYEGWKHFSESRVEIERAFAAAGLAERLRWPRPGVLTAIAPV